MKLVQIINRVESLLERRYHPPKEYSDFEEEVRSYIPEKLEVFLLPEHGFTPRRWGEKRAMYFLDTYRQLMSIPDGWLGLHGSCTSDSVYMSVSNPRVRKRLQDRRLPEEEYHRINTLLDDLYLSLPAATREMVKVSSKGLTVAEVDKRLEALSPELLSVESGISVPTIEKYRAAGWDGAAIANLGFGLREQRTNSRTAKALMDAGVKDWPAVIEAAKHSRCSIKYVIDLIRETGITEDELLGILDEAEYVTRAFAERYRRPRAVGWWVLFQIFRDKGNQDIVRTIDLFIGRYPDIDIDSDMRTEFFESENDT